MELAERGFVADRGGRGAGTFGVQALLFLFLFFLPCRGMFLSREKTAEIKAMDEKVAVAWIQEVTDEGEEAEAGGTCSTGRGSHPQGKLKGVIERGK